MKDILAINFSSTNILTQYSNISKANSSFFFINNGLDENETNLVRECFDKNKRTNRKAVLLEYTKKVSTGKVFQDFFTWALNEECNFLSYSDSENDDGNIINENIEYIRKHVVMGCFVKEYNSPFTLNSKTLMTALNQEMIFASIQKTFSECFNAENPANFLKFFDTLNKAFSTSTYSPFVIR